MFEKTTPIFFLSTQKPKYLLRTLIGALVFGSQFSYAGPTELINMPTARLLPDGTWTLDYAYGKPYVTTMTGITILPWLQVGGGVTRIRNIPGFSSSDPVYGSNYGDYKDKAFFGKAMLYKETEYLPEISFFLNDPEGTGLFQGKGGVVSKRFGPLDLTYGYGSVRPSGSFGGAKLDVFDKYDHKIRAILEYDGNQYKNDPYASQTGINTTSKHINYGAQWDWKMLGAKISHQAINNSTTIEGYIKIPLDEKNLIPKVDEPDRYRKITAQPSMAQWERNPIYRKQLIRALADQDFRDIVVRFDANRRLMAVSASNTRISTMSRAVGRAAQAALLLSPIETDEIQITYVDKRLPLVTYSFTDLKKLRRFFNGQIPRHEIAPTVLIRHTDTANAALNNLAQNDLQYQSYVSSVLEEIQNESSATRFGFFRTGLSASGLNIQGAEDYSLRLSPQLFTYLDGPGSFQYALNAFAGGNIWLTRQTELKGGFMFPVAQNVSDYPAVNTQSNLYPVRSNLPLYYAKDNVKFQQAVLNNYQQLATSTYGRVSAGIYELMYNGVGGQVLYAPQGRNWALDLSVDQVWQRNYDGWFGRTGYNTLQMIGSFHYRFPMGITAAVRGGQFLAKDRGARFEIARTFRSGFELGAWYTVTNANDTITSPGTTYYDKGIWMKIPFDMLTTEDTRNQGTIYYSPWGVNSGQMVQSPQDLYNLIDGPYRYNLSENRALDRLADVDEDPSLPSMGGSRNLLNSPFLTLAQPDIVTAAKGKGPGGTMANVLLGSAITAGSSLLDRKFHDIANNNTNKAWAKNLTSFGNALPYAAIGLAGVAAITEDSRLADTGFAGVLSSLTSVGASYAMKYASGRAGPDQTTNPYFFKPGTNGTFPSTHEAALSGAIAPFAKEYGANWLYTANVFTGLGRILSNNHWFSDTVGGTLLGIGIGNFVWNINSRSNEKSPQVYIQGTGIGVSVPLD